MAALMGPSAAVDHYAAVIPNCYYPDEFDGAVSNVDDRRPYFVFVGRILDDKGLWIILEILKHMPHHILRVAGQGDLDRYTKDADSALRDRIVYHGVLNPSERNDLIVGADAMIAPTIYVEPFGGVMVEAQFLGVPVISTDHAAMSETIWHGVTGFR